MLNYYVDVLQSVSRGCATTGSAKIPATALSLMVVLGLIIPSIIQEEPVASKDEPKPASRLVVGGEEGSNRVLEKSKQVTRQ